MLEPSTPQEAKDMTRVGFEISEKLKQPILLRTTTRLNHARGPVKLEKVKKSKEKGTFEKDPMLVTVPATARAKHPDLLKKMKKAEEISENSQFNEIIINGENSKIGIITSGVSYNYVIEAVEDLKINAKILKLGMTNPIPTKMCKEFIQS